MIQAQELRIGNLVCIDIPFNNALPNIEYAIQDGHDFEKVKKFFPIPITGDWLIKFGLKHYQVEGVSTLGDEADEPTEGDTHWWEIRVKGSEINDSFVLNIVRWGEGEFTFSCHMLRRRLKYVHELQNLYFALTGTELKIQNNDNN